MLSIGIFSSPQAGTVLSTVPYNGMVDVHFYILSESLPSGSFYIEVDGFLESGELSFPESCVACSLPYELVYSSWKLRIKIIKVKSSHNVPHAGNTSEGYLGYRKVYLKLTHISATALDSCRSSE